MCNMIWLSHEKAEKRRGLFCQLNQSCWKLHKMDRSSLRIFSSGGGLFCQLNQSFWKLYEMNRSSLRIFPLGGWGGGGFCQLNQSCWKLHEMERSSLRFFFLWGRGFSAKSLLMRCSMMHKIWFSKFMSHVTI